jgi:signal transduction histidine kinase/CheY-like chemotaxis protein
MSTEFNPASTQTAHWLTGGGEMGERIRSFDWSGSPAGPMRAWPQSLKTAVSICLGSRYPIVIWWGKQALTQFYNDAYISFLGAAKHPGGLGQSARECWSEIWHIIDPMLEGVFATGEATWSRDFLSVIARRLPREEGYFNFSYSPLRDDDGAIGGIFCACYETTDRVIGERRLRTLRDLGRTVTEAKDAEEACAVTARVLEANPADIPFALIYLLDGQSPQARLVATTRLQAGSRAAPDRIEMNEGAQQITWPFQHVCDTAASETVSELAARFGPLPGGLWPESPESALVLPISTPNQPRPIGFLVAGLSPRRIVDADYLSFFDLIAGHLSAAIANARAYEEEKRRAEADARAMERLIEVGNRCWREAYGFEQCLDEILAAAIAITGADKGNIQLLDHESQALRIAAQLGFEEPFLSFFASVGCDEASACGTAMRSRERIIVEDVAKSNVFAGQPSLPVMLGAQVRAVQSTPLVSTSGRVFGMISTHFCRSHRPSERDLRLLDILARQAADVLERKRAEEERARLLMREREARHSAEEANRTKDEFLAVVSHELRTPLSAILGWSHMLRVGAVESDRVPIAIETIERNARAQNQLIDDLLDVSRIITGKLRLDVRPMDPVSCIEAAIESIRPAAAAKEIRVEKVTGPGMAVIPGDAARLQQVVWNLLSNAVKFTPRGGCVRVELHVVDPNVEIVVSDTGNGIKPDFLPFVFERFRQADATTTRAYGGLGLGLAIVRHLVELHGGDVHVESPGEGRGSTFTVRLPLPFSYERHPEANVITAPARVSLPVTDVSERLDGVRVLVVDDEQDTCELLSSMLTKCGAAVTTVTSATSALERMERSFFDLIVSDIGMPGVDGYELMQTIRTLPAQRGGGIPAIALTAYARAEDRLRAIRSGYQMHVPKPIEFGELVTVMANLAPR